MRDRHWAWLGVLAGVCAGVVAFAPAAWLGAALRWATDDRLQLVQPRGTVWSGSGRMVVSDGAASRDTLVLPGRMHWRLGPQRSGLHMQLRADCCTPAPLQMSIRVRWDGWAVSWADHTSAWPAAVLAGLGAPWNTLEPQGELVLGLQALSLEWRDGRTSVAGNVILDVLALSSRLSTLRPIGSYRLRLIGNGGSSGPQLQLQTLDGSLKLAGQGQWNGKRWGFRGEASAAAEDEQVLGNLLNIVGRRQGSRSIIAVD